MREGDPGAAQLLDPTASTGRGPWVQGGKPGAGEISDRTREGFGMTAAFWFCRRLPVAWRACLSREAPRGLQAVASA